MSDKKQLFILLGVIIMIISFIIGLFMGKESTLQVNKNDSSIPLQIEIREIIATNFETETKKYSLNQDEIFIILNIIDDLTFSDVTCDGLPTHIISYNSGGKKGIITYSIERYDEKYHILNRLRRSNIVR